MERDRLIDRQAHKVTVYRSVNEFIATDDRLSGVITVEDGFMPIDLLVSPAESDVTVVFFHGAIEPHFSLPVLSGLGISEGLDVNRVFISDPSLILDRKLLLSWYAGNFYQLDLQDTLETIISKIMDSLQTTRIVFFGGSGGGFASLFYASRFKKSTALVFNPQTNIAKYHQNSVIDFVQKSFLVEEIGSPAAEHIPSNIKTNLCEIYREQIEAQVVYLQNTNDDFHVQAHLRPFLKSNHPDNNLFLLAREWRDGHTPPPKRLLLQTLSAITSLRNPSATLETMGFVKPI